MAAPALKLPAPPSSRADELRNTLGSMGFDGFIIPMNDQYMNEYVPESEQRVKFISGFKGSAGTVIVLKDKAAFFTDGRYTLQASKQVDGKIFEIYQDTVKTPRQWLLENAKPGQVIGYDPKLHSDAAISSLSAAMEAKGLSLQAVPHNPVDMVWSDRPSENVTLIFAQPLKYSGKSSEEKRMELAKVLQKDGDDLAIITNPSSVAWLFNIRGNDVPHTPLPLSMAILKKDGTARLYANPEKVREDIYRWVGKNAYTIDETAFMTELSEIPKDAKVRVSFAESSREIVDTLRKRDLKMHDATDICALSKACKNEVEIRGSRNAHIRDGVAMVTFLAWLDRQIEAGNEIDELKAQDTLDDLRARDPLFRDLSFKTISAAGPNGSVIHYRSEPSTNRTIRRGQFYLVDSGAQYANGTTDITRTVSIGKVSAEMRDRYTRVLKGHIAIAMRRFPQGTAGGQIDSFARQFLWDVGMDYAHGTGHGVGSYLGVHEGPQGIRLPDEKSAIVLKPGMIISNEPGFYKNGEYGIRIENLVAVKKPAADGMLEFETLTVAPIDTRPINLKLMMKEEINWLNAYHSRVRHTLLETGRLDEATARWLRKATRPIQPYASPRAAARPKHNPRKKAKMRAVPA